MRQNYRWLRLLLLVSIVIILFKIPNNKTPTIFERILSASSSHTRLMLSEVSISIVNPNEDLSSSSVVTIGTNVIRPYTSMFIISKVTNSTQWDRKSAPYKRVSSKSPNGISIVNPNENFSSSSVVTIGTNVIRPYTSMLIVSKVTNSTRWDRKSAPYKRVSSKSPNLTTTLTRKGRFVMPTSSTTQVMISVKSTTPGVNAKKIKECVADILAKRLCAAEFAALLELLDDVVAALEAAKITYFMSDGTLIGSWRHHGLIPWDDDIDLWFDSAQYKRAEKALQRVPNSRFEEFWDGFLKVTRDIQRPTTTQTTEPTITRIASMNQSFTNTSVSTKINKNSRSTSMPTWQRNTSSTASKLQQTTMSASSTRSNVFQGFVAGFWPEVGCTTWTAQVDLFSFQDDRHIIIPVIHENIPIARSAVFPLVLRPLEWRSTVPAMNLSMNTWNSYSQHGPNSTSKRGDVYRLLPAPRDPLRVLHPSGYTEIDKRCAVMSHWMGQDVSR